MIYKIQLALVTGAPCLARDLFPWLNTRVKVHISVWTIWGYPKKKIFEPLGFGGYLTIEFDTGIVTCVDLIKIPI